MQHLTSKLEHIEQQLIDARAVVTALEAARDALIDPEKRLAGFQPQLDALLEDKAKWQHERLVPYDEADITYDYVSRAYYNWRIYDPPYSKLLHAERILLCPGKCAEYSDVGMLVEATIRSNIPNQLSDAQKEETRLHEIVISAEQERAPRVRVLLEAYLIPVLAQLVIEMLCGM